ncbi:MAG: hypothetical protein IJV35_04425 [Neisseriaceae bacterium]|nr:hypothetical protein [Neisseriaceae bacterium]
MSLRDLTQSNRGNPVKNRRFFTNADRRFNGNAKSLSGSLNGVRMSVTTPLALIKNLTIFYWIATTGLCPVSQ